MTQTTLSVATAIGMLRTIELYTPSDFHVLGITHEDFEMVAGEIVWKREDRGRVLRTLNAIIFGSCEIMALPKIVVPAEFVAAHVATLVHPANRMHCCIWLAQERQTGVGALELASRAATPSQYDPASADNLFALVCMLSDTTQSNYARQRFMVRLGLRVEEAERNL